MRMRNRLLLGITGILLVFSMVFLGCGDGAGDPPVPPQLASGTNLTAKAGSYDVVLKIVGDYLTFSVGEFELKNIPFIQGDNKITFQDDKGATITISYTITDNQVTITGITGLDKVAGLGTDAAKAVEEAANGGLQTDGTIDEDPTVAVWKNVTSLAQLDGTWQGAFNYNIAVLDVLDLVLFITESEVPPDMQPAIEGMLAEISLDLDVQETITIDADKETLSVDNGNIRAVLSGGQINNLWTLLFDEKNPLSIPINIPEFLEEVKADLPKGIEFVVDEQNPALAITITKLDPLRIAIEDLKGLGFQVRGDGRYIRTSPAKALESILPSGVVLSKFNLPEEITLTKVE
jgi:hypothetical protein